MDANTKAIRPAFVSECGCFVAYPYGDRGTDYDVIEVATGAVWLHRRYQASGFDDTDRRYTHAEFPRMVTGWSNRGRQRGRSWTPDFELRFAEVDTTIPIKAFTGNVVLRNYEATFRRAIPRNHTRRLAQFAEIINAALAGGGQ